jgi:hypothetical protein
MADSTVSIYSPIRSSGGAYLTRDIAFREFANIFASQGSVPTVKEGYTINSHEVTAKSTPTSGINISAGVSVLNVKIGTDANGSDIYSRVPFETVDIATDLTLSNCPVAFGRKDLVCIKYVLTPASASIKLVTVEGTASASPKYPTLTNDGFTTFYLPIAGISRVANASTVQNSDIITTGVTDRGTPSLTIASILWQSGNIIRYTFSGSPDLSAISQGDVLIVTGATLPINNGTFTILNTNNVSDYVEVINTARSDATSDQVGSAGSAIREEYLRQTAFINSSTINNDKFVELAGSTMTGKLQWGTTTTSGLRLNNLTSAQRTAMVKQAGDPWLNTDTGSLEYYDGVNIVSAVNPLITRTGKVTASNIFF